MHYIEHKYTEGQKVRYRGGFGRGPVEEVTIETAEYNKNGRPVYDLDNGHWCYEEQIIGLVRE